MVLSKLFTSRTSIITTLSGNKTNATSNCKRRSPNKYRNLIVYSNYLVKKQSSFEKINNAYVLKKCNSKCLSKCNFYSDKTSLGTGNSIFHLKSVKSFNFLKNNCNVRLSHSYNLCNSRNNYMIIQSNKNLVIRPTRLNSFKNFKSFVQEKAYGDNAYNKSNDHNEGNIKEKVDSNAMDKVINEQNKAKNSANSVYYEAVSKTYENQCNSESTGNLEHDKRKQDKNLVTITNDFVKIPIEINNNIQPFQFEQENQNNQTDNLKKEIIDEDFHSAIENGKIAVEDCFQKMGLHVDKDKVISYYQKSTEDKMKAYCENNEEYFENLPEIKPFVVGETNSERIDKKSDLEYANLNELPINNNHNTNNSTNSSTILNNEVIGQIHELSETSVNYELIKNKEEEMKISDEMNDTNLDIKTEKLNIEKSHCLNLNCDILPKGVSKSRLKENTIHKTPENIDARNYSTVITCYEKFNSKMEDEEIDKNSKNNNLFRKNYMTVNNDILRKRGTENLSFDESLDAEKYSCSEYADSKKRDFYHFNGNNSNNNYKESTCNELVGESTVNSDVKATTNELDKRKQSYKNLELYRINDLGEAITKNYDDLNEDFDNTKLNESSSEANSTYLRGNEEEIVKIQQKILAAEKNCYGKREVLDSSLLPSGDENGNNKTELYKIQQKILSAEKKITDVVKSDNDPQISQPKVFNNKRIDEPKRKTDLQKDRDEARLQDEDDNDVYILTPINEKNFNSLKDSEEEIFILTELPSNNVTTNDNNSEGVEYSIILNKNQMDDLLDEKEYYKNNESGKVINIKEKQYKISDISTTKTNNLLDSKNSDSVKNDSVVNTSDFNEKKGSNDLISTKKETNNDLNNNSKSNKMSNQLECTGIEQLQENNLSNLKKNINTAPEKNRNRKNRTVKTVSDYNTNSSNDKNEVHDKNSALSKKLFPGVNNINNVVSTFKKVTKHSCINKGENFTKKETNTSNKSVKKDNRSRKLYSNFCDKMDTSKRSAKDSITEYNNSERTKLNTNKKVSHNYRILASNNSSTKELKINRHPLLNNAKVNLTHMKHYKTDQTDKKILNSEKIDGKITISKTQAEPNEIKTITNNCKSKPNTGVDECNKSMIGLNNVKNDNSGEKNIDIIKNVSKKSNETDSDLLNDVKYYCGANNCKETLNYTKNIASTLKSVDCKFQSDHTDTTDQLLVLSENENLCDKYCTNDKADQSLFNSNDSDFIKTNKLGMFGIKSFKKVLSNDENSSDQISYEQENKNLRSDPFGLRTPSNEKYSKPSNSLKNKNVKKSDKNLGKNVINSRLQDTSKLKSYNTNSKVIECENSSSKIPTPPVTEVLENSEINWNDSITMDDFTPHNSEVEINKMKTIKAFEDRYPCRSYLKNYVDYENKIKLKTNKNVKAVDGNKISNTANVEYTNIENKFKVDAFNSYSSPLNHLIHKEDDKNTKKIYFTTPEKSNKSRYNSQIPKAINKQSKNMVMKNIDSENNGQLHKERENETENTQSSKTESLVKNEIQSNLKSDDIIFSLLEEKVRSSIDTDKSNDIYIDNIDKTESPLHKFKINQNLRAWEKFKQGYFEDILYENNGKASSENIKADSQEQELLTNLKENNTAIFERDINGNSFVKNEASHKLSETNKNLSIQKDYSNTEIENSDKLLKDIFTGMNKQNILSSRITSREVAENGNASVELSNLRENSVFCKNKLDNYSGSVPDQNGSQNTKCVLMKENEDSYIKNEKNYDKILKENDKNLNYGNNNYCITQNNISNISKSEEHIDLLQSDCHTSDDKDISEIRSLIKLLSECLADQQSSSSSITDELLMLGKKYKQRMKDENLNNEQDSDEDIENLLANCMIEAASGCVEQDYSLEFIDSKTRVKLMEEIFEDEDKFLNRDYTQKTLSVDETDLLSNSETTINNLNLDGENNKCETINHDTQLKKYSSNSESNLTIGDEKYEAPQVQLMDIFNFGENLASESCKILKGEAQSYLQTSHISLKDSSMRGDCLPILALSKEKKISNIPSTVTYKTDRTLRNDKSNAQIIAQRSFSTSSKTINEEERNTSVPEERSTSTTFNSINGEETNISILKERSCTVPVNSINVEEKPDTFNNRERSFSTPVKFISKEKINASVLHQRSFSTEKETKISVPLERSFTVPVNSVHVENKPDRFANNERSFSTPIKLIGKEKINTSALHQRSFSTEKETNILVLGENVTKEPLANLKQKEQPLKDSSVTDYGKEQRCLSVLNGKTINKKETDTFDQHENKRKVKVKIQNEKNHNLHNLSKPVYNQTVNKNVRIMENEGFNNPYIVKKEIRQMAELIQNIKCLKRPSEIYSSHTGNNLNKIENNCFQSNEEALKNGCSEKFKNDEQIVIGKDFNKNSPYVMYPLLVGQDKLCGSLSQKQTSYSSISNNKLCCGGSYSTNRKFSYSSKDCKNSSTKEAIKKQEKNSQENSLDENLTLIFPKDKKLNNSGPELEKETENKKSIKGRDILRIFHSHLIKKLKSTISNTENNKANTQSDQKMKLNIKQQKTAKNSTVENKSMHLRHYSGPVIHSPKAIDSSANNSAERKEISSLNTDDRSTKKKKEKIHVKSSRCSDRIEINSEKKTENQRNGMTENTNTLIENYGSTNKCSKLPEKAIKNVDNQIKTQSDSAIVLEEISDTTAMKISNTYEKGITKLVNEKTKNVKDRTQTLSGSANVVVSSGNPNKIVEKCLTQVDKSQNNCGLENKSKIIVESTVTSNKSDKSISDKDLQKPISGDSKTPLQKDDSNIYLTDKSNDKSVSAVFTKENVNNNSITNSETLIKSNEDTMKNIVKSNNNCEKELLHKDLSDSVAEGSISARDKDNKSCSSKETKQNLSKSVKVTSQIPLPTKGNPLDSGLKITRTTAKKINTTSTSESENNNEKSTITVNNSDERVLDGQQQSKVQLSNEEKAKLVKLNSQETEKPVISHTDSKSDVTGNIYHNASQMNFSLKNNTENTEFNTKTYLVDVQKNIAPKNTDTTGCSRLNILEPTTQTKEDEYNRAAVLYEVLDSDEFSVHENKTNGFTKTEYLAEEKSTDNPQNMINEMFTEVQEEIFLTEKIREGKYDKCVKNETHSVLHNNDKKKEDYVSVKNKKSLIINKPDVTCSEKSDIANNHEKSMIIIKSAQKILSDLSDSNDSVEKSESSISTGDMHDNISSITNKDSNPIIVVEKNSQFGSSKEEKFSNSYGNNNVPTTLNKFSDVRESGDFEPDFNEYLEFFKRPNLKNFLNEYNFPLTNDDKIDVQYPVGSFLVPSRYDATFLRKIFRNLPSVSTILNNTLSVPSISALNKWRTKLTMKFGDSANKKLNEDCMNYDTQFHDYIQKYLSGIPFEELCAVAHPAVKNCLKSLRSVFTHLSDITFVETHTIHSQLPYHGIIDCVARYKNTPVLIEWKQADNRTRLLRLTHDAPIQLVAYLGAFNHDKIYKFQVTSGLIVIAYTDGSPADVFLLSNDDCDKYWRVWLSRLTDFLHMRKGHQNFVK